MSTIVGLRSGRDFVVGDGYHPFTNKRTHEVTYMFFSPDEKRVITIPPKSSSIEFFDEPTTPEFVEHIKNGQVSAVEVEPEQHNDPNIG